MIDPNHKATSIIGTIGTAVSWAFHYANEINWSQVSGFLTCVAVLYGLWKSWKNGKGS